MTGNASGPLTGLSSSETEELKRELNSYAARIGELAAGVRGGSGGGRGARTEEAAECIQNFITFFDAKAQLYGAHPQFFLGQHVCCNVVFVVLENVVKPALTHFCQFLASDAYANAQRKKKGKGEQGGTAGNRGSRPQGGDDAGPHDYRSEKKARALQQHVVRPFRQLLEALHRYMPMEPTTAALLLLLPPSSSSSASSGAGLHYPANTRAENSTADALVGAAGPNRSGAANGQAGTRGAGGGKPSVGPSGAFDGGLSSDIESGIELFDVYASVDCHANPSFATTTLPLTGEDDDGLVVGSTAASGGGDAFQLSSSLPLPPPPSSAVLLYKQTAPLLALLQHILEVLQSTVLSPVVGVDYALMLNEVLNWSGYVLQLPGPYVVDVCDRLLSLLELVEVQGKPSSSATMRMEEATNSGGSWARPPSQHATLSPTVEEGVVYAQVLAKLFLLPQCTSAFREGSPGPARPPRASFAGGGGGTDTEKDNVSHVVSRLVALVHLRHRHRTNTMKLEATLLTALRNLTFTIQYDFPDAARAPLLALSTHLCDFFLLPETLRKDLWRLGLYAFLSQQLCVNFASVLGHGVLKDVLYGLPGKRDRRPRTSVGGGNATRGGGGGGCEGDEEALVDEKKDDAAMDAAVIDHDDDDRDEGGEGEDQRRIAPDLLCLLHETLFPMCLHVFTQSRQSFSFVSRRELLHFPCPAAGLSDLFDFGSVVVYLVTATYPQYDVFHHAHRHEAVGGGGGEADILPTTRFLGDSSSSFVITSEPSVPQARQPPHRKRDRSEEGEEGDGDTARRQQQERQRNREERDPAERLLEILRSVFFVWTGARPLGEGSSLGEGTDTGTTAAAGGNTYGDDGEVRYGGSISPMSGAASVVQEMNSDAPLYLLHLFAQPATALHFTAKQLSTLVNDILLPIFASPHGSQLSSLLLAALRAALSPSPRSTSSRTNSNHDDSSGCTGLPRGAAGCEEAIRLWTKQTAFAWLSRHFLQLPAAAAASSFSSPSASMPFFPIIGEGEEAEGQHVGEAAHRHAFLLSDEQFAASLGEVNGDGSGGGGFGVAQDKASREAAYQLLIMLVDCSLLHGHSPFPLSAGLAEATAGRAPSPPPSAPPPLLPLRQQAESGSSLRVHAEKLSARALAASTLAEVEARIFARASSLRRETSRLASAQRQHGATDIATALARPLSSVGENAPNMHALLSPAMLLSLLRLLASYAVWALEAQFHPNLCSANVEAAAMPAAAAASPRKLEREGEGAADEHARWRAAADAARLRLVEHQSVVLATAASTSCMEGGLLLAFHGAANACVFYDCGRGSSAEGVVGPSAGHGTGTRGGEATSPSAAAATAEPTTAFYSGGPSSSFGSAGASAFPFSPSATTASANADEIAAFGSFLSSVEIYAVAVATSSALAEQQQQQQQQQQQGSAAGGGAATGAAAALLRNPARFASPQLRHRARSIHAYVVGQLRGRFLTPDNYLPYVAARAAESHWLLLPRGGGGGGAATGGAGRESSSSSRPPPAEGPPPTRHAADHLPDVDGAGKGGGGRKAAVKDPLPAAAADKAREGGGPPKAHVKAGANFIRTLAACVCRTQRLLAMRMATANAEADMLCFRSSSSTGSGKGHVGGSSAAPSVPGDEVDGETGARYRWRQQPAHGIARSGGEDKGTAPALQPEEKEQQVGALLYGSAGGVGSTLSSAMAAWRVCDVTTCVQCVQFLHVLLRLYRCGLWHAPGEDMERPSSSSPSCTTGSAPATTNPSPFPSPGDAEDLHVFSTTSDLFAAAPEAMLARLSPNGRIYFVVLWLSHHLSGKLVLQPTSSFLALQPCYRAIRFFFQDCGRAFLSPRFACAEARQIPLRFANAILHQVLDDGVRRLSRWRPSNPTSIDLTLPVYDALRTSLDVERHILFALTRSNVLAMAVADDSGHGGGEETRANRHGGRPDLLPAARKVREALVALLREDMLLSRAGEEEGGTHPEQRADDGTGHRHRHALAGLVDLRDGQRSTRPALVESEQPQPFPPFSFPILSSVGQLLSLVRFVCDDDDAEVAECRLLRSLFRRSRFCALPSLFALLQRSSDYAWLALASAEADRGRGPGAEEAAELTRRVRRTRASLADVGTFLVHLLESLVDAARTDMPSTTLATPRAMCAVLSAVSHVLPGSDAVAAEWLGKFSFDFLSSSSSPSSEPPRSSRRPSSGVLAAGGLRRPPFRVRCHAAVQVGALFSRFRSRAGNVLQELLHRCREGVLSRNALHCAASLLALSEACLAAPWLEAKVLYTLLECWSTRGFLFRPLLLQCLSRIAGGVYREEDKKGSCRLLACLQPHAQLCGLYVRPLLHWWLWRDRHPIDALPVECFGVTSVDVFLRVHSEAVLPISLLLLMDAAGDAPAERDDGEEVEGRVGDATYFSFPLLLPHWAALRADDALVRVACACYSAQLHALAGGADGSGRDSSDTVPSDESALPARKKRRQQQQPTTTTTTNTAHHSFSTDSLEEVLMGPLSSHGDGGGGHISGEAADEGYSRAMQRVVLLVLTQNFSAVYVSLMLWASASAGDDGGWRSDSPAIITSFPSSPPPHGTAHDMPLHERHPQRTGEAAARALTWLKRSFQDEETAFVAASIRFSAPLLSRAPISLQRYLVLALQRPSTATAATASPPPPPPPQLLDNWQFLLLVHTDSLFRQLLTFLGEVLPCPRATSRERDGHGYVDSVLLHMVAESMSESVVAAHEALEASVEGFSADMQRQQQQRRSGKAAPRRENDPFDAYAGADVDGDALLFGGHHPVSMPRRDGAESRMNRLFFSDHGGHVYSLLMALYARVWQSPGERLAQHLSSRLDSYADEDRARVAAGRAGDAGGPLAVSRGANTGTLLSLLAHVCTRWLSREVCRLPHVFRTILSLCLHVLSAIHVTGLGVPSSAWVGGRSDDDDSSSGGTLAPPLQAMLSAREAEFAEETVCNILLHVWPVVTAAEEEGRRGTAPPPPPPPSHPFLPASVLSETVSVMATKLAATMLSLAPESALIASTWAALCRADSRLAARDWGSVTATTSAAAAAASGSERAAGAASPRDRGSEPQGQEKEEHDDFVVVSDSEEEGESDRDKRAGKQRGSGKPSATAATPAPAPTTGQAPFARVLPLLESGSKAGLLSSSGGGVGGSAASVLFLQELTAALDEERSAIALSIARHALANRQPMHNDGEGDDEGKRTGAAQSVDARVSRACRTCAQALLWQLRQSAETDPFHESSSARQMQRVGYAGTSPQTSGAARAAMMDLLRSLCLCFVEADAVDQLEEAVRATQHVDVVGELCERRRRQQRGQRSRPGTSDVDRESIDHEEEDAFSFLDEALLGRPYAAHIERLYALSFSADPHVAALAADALATWLAHTDDMTDTAPQPPQQERQTGKDSELVALVWRTVKHNALADALHTQQQEEEGEEDSVHPATTDPHRPLARGQVAEAALKRFQHALSPFRGMSPQALGLPALDSLPSYHALVLFSSTGRGVEQLTTTTTTTGAVAAQLSQLLSQKTKAALSVYPFAPSSSSAAAALGEEASPSRAAAAAAAASPSGASSHRYSLLDMRVWQCLSFLHNEAVFLPLFVLAAIHTYNLDGKYRILAACVPLLEYEAAVASPAATATIVTTTTTTTTTQPAPTAAPLRRDSVGGVRSALIRRLTQGRDVGGDGWSVITTTAASPRGGAVGQFGLALFPIVLSHIFLAKESDSARALRRQWGELLSRYATSRPLDFPVTNRLLLACLHSCQLALMRRVRVYGLKGSNFANQPQPHIYLQQLREHRAKLVREEEEEEEEEGKDERVDPTIRNAKADVDHKVEELLGIASRFGAVPVVADMQDCHWLSEIPARDLARASALLEEPYLAMRFVELAGESLLQARGGIPASLMSGGAYAHLSSSLQGGGGAAAAVLDGNEAFAAAAASSSSLSLANATSSASWLAVAATPFSVLFPSARRQDYSRRGSTGTSSAVSLQQQQQQRPSSSASVFSGGGGGGGGGEEAGRGGVGQSSIAARGSRRVMERGEALLLKLRGFELLVQRVCAAVTMLVPLDLPSSLLLRGSGGVGGESSGQPSGKGTGSNEDASTALANALRQLERCGCMSDSVDSSRRALVDHPSVTRDAALAAAAGKARRLTAAGLPETALEVLLSLSEGLSPSSSGVAQLPTFGALGQQGMWEGREASSQQVRSAAAEAAWRCGQWWYHPPSSHWRTSPPATLGLVDRVARRLSSGATGDTGPSTFGFPSATGAAAAVTADLAGTVAAASAASFHEAILAALRHMQQGQYAAVAASVRAGQLAVYRGLSRTNWLDAVLAAEALHDVQSCASSLWSHQVSGKQPATPTWLPSPSSSAAERGSGGHALFPLSSVSCAGMMLLDEVRNALCQVARQRHWACSHVVASAKRALAAREPQRAYRWLTQLQDLVRFEMLQGDPSLLQTNAAVATAAAAAQKANSDVLAHEAAFVVADDTRVELTLLYAQCLHALGRPMAAVSLLQRTGGGDRVEGASAGYAENRDSSSSSGHNSEDSDDEEEEGPLFAGLRNRRAGSHMLAFLHASPDLTVEERGRQQQRRRRWLHSQSALFRLPSSAPLVPQVVIQTLQWVNELQLSPPSRVVRDPLLAKASSQDPSGRSCLALGRMCHRLADEIATRVRSHEFQELRKSVKASQQMRDRLKWQRELGRQQQQQQQQQQQRGSHTATSGQPNAPQHVFDEQQDLLLRKRIDDLDKELAIEEAEFYRQLSDYTLFRRSAMNSYARYLQHSGPCGEDDVHTIFGFVELWFRNQSERGRAGTTTTTTATRGSEDAPSEDPMEDLLDEGNPDSAISRFDPRTKAITEGVLLKALTNTPTAKFLPLFTQLAARLGGCRDEDLLADLIGRVTLAHPLHCVWPLLALANGRQPHGDADARGSAAAAQQQHGGGVRVVDLRKVSAAKAVLDSLRETLRAEAAREVAQQQQQQQQQRRGAVAGNSGKGDEDDAATQEANIVQARTRSRGTPQMQVQTRKRARQTPQDTEVRELLLFASTSAGHKLRMVEQAITLSAAYMELACHKPTPRVYNVIAEDFRLRSDVQDFAIPPPTELPPALGGSAATATATSALAEGLMPTIVRYKPIFTSPGGINVPKVIRCELSDGSTARQLLKANDDLRQDALIEQVFLTANLLFLQASSSGSGGGGGGGGNDGLACGTACSMGLPSIATRDRQARRTLSLRTYNVVPLAPAVGVVQWVDHTITLGDYLNGPHRSRRDKSERNEMTGIYTPPGGAHERYFPGEPSSADCREKLQKAAKSERHATLLQIYSEFSPALHYFFAEKFPSAQEHLSKQQSYVRSAAAASMVGYLVGLGDRHASNVLLETCSGEMVHIDLGIAFDQSKLLRIPERVPFRLTRNIVDGFGVRGTGGGFQYCCESALHVLRTRRDMLATILSSFLHDPLARWTVTAQQPHSHEQDGQAPERTHVSAADAKRTMAKVSAKLAGYDGSDQLSVASQVRKLIEEAQSTDNLAAMFEGWSAWL